VKRALTVMVLFAAAHGPDARAQCARPGNCADLRVGSGAVGYGLASITRLGGVTDRVVQGFNARADIHILSLLLRRVPVRTYDAMFGDVTYGRMTSDTLPGLFPGDEQGRIGFQATFGYHFLAGVQARGAAVLAGVGWQSHYHDIAGSTLTGSSVPIVTRIELGQRRPVVITGWYGVSGEALAGGRVDLPLFRRLNFTATYWQADGEAEVWSNPGVKVPARGRVLMLGVRSAELR